MNHCGHKATAIHTYGVYEINGVPRDLPMNEIALCDSCGADLWAQIKDAVAAQHMHYGIKPMHNVRVEPTPKAVGSNEGLCARNEKRGNDGGQIHGV